MAEYVRKDAVLWITTELGAWETQNRVRELPSEDVQPVKHAYWIELPKALNPNENPCKCSNCGHILSFMNYYPKSKYCDDCGARMDLKGGETE